MKLLSTPNTFTHYILTSIITCYDIFSVVYAFTNCRVIVLIYLNLYRKQL